MRTGGELNATICLKISHTIICIKEITKQQIPDLWHHYEWHDEIDDDDSDNDANYYAHMKCDVQNTFDTQLM